MRKTIFAAALLLGACGDKEAGGNNAVADAGSIDATTADNGSGPAPANASEPAAADAAEPLASGRDLDIALPGLGHPVGEGVRFFCLRFDEDQMTEARSRGAAATIDRLAPELRKRGVGIEYRLQPAADRELQLAQCRLEAPSSVGADQVLLIALSGMTETNLSLRRGDYALDTTDRQREPAQWLEAYFGARLGRPDAAAES